MANLTVFSVKTLSIDDFKIFKGLYIDFKNRAKTDFKFDLEPLDYEDFVYAIQNKLLKCLVLYENSIPTGFLIYTTLISYSLELNLIYINSDENYETKIRYLIGEFLAIEEEIVKQKIITYPLLGEQEKYKNILSEYGFKYVSQSVLKFDFTNPYSITKINESQNLIIPYDYSISCWQDEYFDEAANIIHKNFKSANDALFDSRFLTLEGTKDIVGKIVNSGYGEFLRQYTKVIHKYDKMVGVCFVNVTGDHLINIPLVAVENVFRHQNLGKKMVSLAVKEVFEDTLNIEQPYTEVNVTTDTSNLPAVKMYEYCGFIEDYKYIQSYKN